MLVVSWKLFRKTSGRPLRERWAPQNNSVNFQVILACFDGTVLHSTYVASHTRTDPNIAYYNHNNMYVHLLSNDIQGAIRVWGQEVNSFPPAHRGWGMHHSCGVYPHMSNDVRLVSSSGRCSLSRDKYKWWHKWQTYSSYSLWKLLS